MLKTILDFSPAETITLIPNSGVQFIDFAFDVAQVARVSRPVTCVEQGSGGAEGWRDMVIYPVHSDAEGERFYRPRGQTSEIEVDEDASYSIKAETALSRLDNLWLPFPFFRLSDKGFDEGPTTWARIKVVRLPEPDAKGRTHRVVLAFDTLLTPRLPGQPYTAPEENSDATDKVTFGFCADHDANIGFMSLPWVAGWLRDQYVAGYSREKGRAIRPDTIANPGEHWAAYMALIDAIAAACTIPNIELVDIFSRFGRSEPVGVSLVLDVGNSRMCGVLVEAGSARNFADVAQTYRLELRDLSRIEHAYSEPFESRIEFATADFGPVRHASASQRVKREAFFWPSPVRVGPEAARLASLTDGTEGSSGLSSPKRYLWDSEARPQPWINNNSNIAAGAEPQEIRGQIISKLTENGRLVKRVKGGLPGLQKRYSRSSIYMLMLCELLIQAMAQINSVEVRRNRPDSASPRRLRQVILTLPTATPLAEQKVMRARIAEAMEIVWEVMGFNDTDEDGRPILVKPDIRLDWDEATCTHLVYLYNEIQDRFHGTPREFFSLMARPGQGQGNGDSLRIASIDIGGGTTDLMILSHDMLPRTDTVLMPRQVFREGFRQAGDDILKEIIQDYLLPEIADWLSAQGVNSPDMVISRIFGGNRDGMGQRERTMRAQLVAQVLSAAAVGLLGIYEAGHMQSGESLRLGSLLPQDAVVAEPALRWFRDSVWPQGGANLLDATIGFDPLRLERLIKGLVGPMIRDLCDLVRCHDCDILLVSGRPSRLPVFRRLIESSMPVAANRIITMGDYRVGNWYPFRSDDFRIRDPKTTAVVGAMLCHICSQSVSNLTLRTDELKMRSTARFVGAMFKGAIPADKVLLTNVDLDSGKGVDEFHLFFESNCFIGFRQLEIPRWPASPLYSVRFADPEKTPAGVALPLKVTFQRVDARTEADEQHALEDFKIVEVEDADRNDLGPRAVKAQLQTMIIENQAEAGYWLDTGVLQMRVG